MKGERIGWDLHIKKKIKVVQYAAKKQIIRKFLTKVEVITNKRQNK